MRKFEIHIFHVIIILLLNFINNASKANIYRVGFKKFGPLVFHQWPGHQHISHWYNHLKIYGLCIALCISWIHPMATHGSTQLFWQSSPIGEYWQNNWVCDFEIILQPKRFFVGELVSKDRRTSKTLCTALSGVLRMTKWLWLNSAKQYVFQHKLMKNIMVG